MRARTLLAGLAAALAACSTSPSRTVNAPVQGTWSYTGTQTSPARTLTGTLTIPTVGGGTFTGSLAVIERDQNNNQTGDFSGPINGESLDSTHVSFDAAFTSETAVRQHVGVVSGDTLKGNWVEQDGGTTYSGSFTAIRTGP